jgi:hypothetical protein
VAETKGQEVNHPNVDGIRISRTRPDFLFPGESLRMRQDHILVEPLEWDTATAIIAIRKGNAVRGKVKAVGPGKYRREYSKDRSRTWLSETFIPTQVKVGDIVELGGLEVQGYDFPKLIVDGKDHIICSERDVAIVRDDLK